MPLRQAFLRRWVRTVWSAALAWAVLPTLMAMAGLTPVPSVAMSLALGEVCSVNAPAAPSSDMPVGAAHGGASCLLCVLSVPMAAAPTSAGGLPRPADPAATPCTSTVRTLHATPHPRRACPQGPPARSCAVLA